MEKGKFRFAVDVDGVVRDIISKMVSLYNREFHTSVSASDIKEYDMRDVFTKVDDPCRYFFEENAREVFFESEPFPFAINAINTLREYGTVSLVTKQTSLCAMTNTLEWLTRHGIPYDSICFTGDDKSHIVDGFDWLIDDYWKNIENAGTPSKVLIDAPYNRNADIIKTVEGSHNIMRYKSLWDFSKDFDMLRKTIEITGRIIG